MIVFAAIINKYVYRIFPIKSYLRYTWILFFVFVVAECCSLTLALWMLAFLSFIAVREYFSLIDIRLQDRLGIFGAYLFIPFMYFCLQINWYGMFIISIPVYSFLTIPILVTMGGKETRGTVFSVGAIDFGMFLFVYCLGHVGALLNYSPWKAGAFVLSIVICDSAACLAKAGARSKAMDLFVRYFMAMPLVIGLLLLLSGWSGIPAKHAISLGMLVPLLSIMGHQTVDYIRADLGIEEDELLPGRGQILCNMQSLLYAAPVVYHYIRYYLHNVS
jgi:phosphatidate cytidylyltransferase